jgi:hypothetical protein
VGGGGGEAEVCVAGADNLCSAGPSLGRRGLRQGRGAEGKFRNLASRNIGGCPRGPAEDAEFPRDLIGISRVDPLSLG